MRRVFTSRRGVISPRHVTSLSRILIRVVGNLTPKSSAQSSLQSSKNQQNHRIIIGIISGTINPKWSIINGPPTGHQDNELSTLPLRAVNRAILRAILQTIHRTIRRVRRHHRTERYERSVERVVTAGLASNEPPRYKQAAGPPPGLCRTNRRDTSKPSGRRRACGERTAAILAILQQPPGLHPESTVHLSGESHDS